MIDVIEDPQFKKLKLTGHAFFTRKGGVSNGYYHSLNCSYFGLDDHKNVMENRQRAMAYLNIPLKSLIILKNVHSNKVIVVDDLSLEYHKLEADATVTQCKDVVLASDTADCPIILFSDENAEVIGLAHAGWRGAKHGIIEATIDKMIALGAHHQNICATISPCITQENYEVSAAFYQDFISMENNNTTYFKISPNTDYFMFDLLNFNKDKLIKQNLKSVTLIGIDTYANEDLFFSCRRSYHRGEPDFGCQLACIYFR
ncbi:MAG: peptidoglycan editing factor PgeF [bacterium]|nr:peptidoglycan editing factor PgeF [bacterium]